MVLFLWYHPGKTHLSCSWSATAPLPLQESSPASTASLGTLPSCTASLDDCATLASTATAHGSPPLCQGTASRAGSPEPQLLAEQASQLNCGDAEAVCLAAMALQMSQARHRDKLLGGRCLLASAAAWLSQRV